MVDPAAPTARRQWAQVLLGGAAVGALALVISALGVLPGTLPGAGAGEGPADGYPLRIARPYVIRELPASPGALAGLLRSDDGAWLAVSPSGRVWDLTEREEGFDVPPALSDDGRILGYLRSSDDGYGEYVLHDLTSGVITAFPDVSSAATESDTEFWAADQHPAYVSPDGQRVLVPGGRRTGRDADGLLLQEGGGVRELFVAGTAFPAGWLPGGRFAWLRLPYDISRPTRSPEIVVTTGSGEELGSLELQLTQPMRLDQWSARVSPDGELVALTEELDGLRGVVVRVSLGDGREVERSDPVSDAMVGQCQASWRDDEALVPTTTGDGSTVTTGLALVDTGGAPVVLADPRLEGVCSLWAPLALSGEAHRGLGDRVLGTSQSWWSWRWRELAAGLLLGLAAAGVWLTRHQAPVVEQQAPASSA